MARKTTPKGKTRSGLVAALDVGTTKICCFIARTGGEGGPEVIGIGHQISNGLRGGVVVDMDAAEAAIRAAVETAEQMSGQHIEQVVVNLSGGQPQSRRISFEVALAGHQIDDTDLRRVLDPSWLHQQQPHDRKLIHAIPISFSIDGNRGVHDPRGMVGERLGVDLHVVTVASGTARNLASCIGRCHLNVGTEVVAPYAAGLGCLVEDELRLGSAVVDMGGGATGLAVFYEGEMIHVDSVPVGGSHVTNDIARGLSTTVANAERIKTLFGSAKPSARDDTEFVRVPLVGEEEEQEAHQVPRSDLVRIIEPRIEETIELVRQRLEASGVERLTGRHLVLTGGASQLPGVREMFAEMLDKQVRIGRPVGIAKLAESTAGPAFATGAGLLRYALEKERSWPNALMRQAEIPHGLLGRLGAWLKGQ